MNVLIIGGGLAGLSAATLLTRLGIQVTTVTPEFGGELANIAVPNPYGEGVFRFDYGAKAYPNNGPFSQLIRGVEGIVLHERAEYYLELDRPGEGHMIPWPMEDHADHTPKIRNIEPGPEPGYDNPCLTDWARHKYGEGFTDDFFEPFYERKFSIAASSLDTDWVDHRRHGHSNEFVYVPGHHIVQTMLASLMQNSEGGWNWVNGMVEQLYHTRQGWNVVGRTGSSMLTCGPFDAVISTMGIAPLVASLERIHGVNMPMTPWNNIICAGVMLKEPMEGQSFTTLYPDVSLRCHRVTPISRLHPEMAPPEHDSLLFEFPTQDEMSQNVFESMAIDVQSILDMLGVESNAVTWLGGKGYPSPSYKLRPDIAETKRQLARHNIYSIGKWGSHVDMSPDHILGEALRCINYVLSGEEEYEYLWSTDYYQCYEEGKYAS
jgi:protoporphyrinogen oxidase